jgi:hypothetical protein
MHLREQQSHARQPCGPSTATYMGVLSNESRALASGLADPVAARMVERLVPFRAQMWQGIMPEGWSDVGPGVTFRALTAKFVASRRNIELYDHSRPGHHDFRR